MSSQIYKNKYTHTSSPVLDYITCNVKASHSQKRQKAHDTANEKHFYLIKWITLYWEIK